MKKAILFITGLMIFMSIILTFFIEPYSTAAMFQGCAVALVGAVMLMLAHRSKLSDAFHYSLISIFALATIVEWILSFFAPSKLTNSWFVIMALAIFVFEAILLVVSNVISNINSI